MTDNPDHLNDRDVPWIVEGRNLTDAEAGSMLRELFVNPETIEVMFQLCQFSSVEGIDDGHDQQFGRCLRHENWRRFVQWLRGKIGIPDYHPFKIYCHNMEEEDGFNSHPVGANHAVWIQQRWCMRYLLTELHITLFDHTEMGIYSRRWKAKNSDAVNWAHIKNLIQDDRCDFWHPEITTYLTDTTRNGMFISWEGLNIPPFLTFLLRLWVVPVDVLVTFDERNREVVRRHASRIGEGRPCCVIETEVRDEVRGAACYVYEQARRSVSSGINIMLDPTYKYLLRKFRDGSDCIHPTLDVGQHPPRRVGGGGRVILLTEAKGRAYVDDHSG